MPFFLSEHNVTDATDYLIHASATAGMGNKKSFSFDMA